MAEQTRFRHPRALGWHAQHCGMSFYSAACSLCRGLALCALLAHGVSSLAEQTCGPAGDVSSCYAGLTQANVRRMVTVQERPLWCWAASISMIFAHYGYKVAQSEIVKDSYGVADDLPAASGEAITRSLSSAWTTKEEKAFQASALASDRQANRFDVTNEMVLSELAEGRPLLIGAQGHAIVLVGLRFQRSARGGVRIVGGTVIDPAPGQEIRDIAPSEMRPAYVAAVHVR